MARLAAIVPATNGPPTLDRCLEAIRGAAEPPEELIVVERPELGGPAKARNQGALQAGGDILVFVDADVEVHPDAFARIRDAFERDPELTAVFGSYDDRPSAPGVVSAFRNLLHHHVHQTSAGPAGTFWAGLGALRRDRFLAAGGFIEHPIEDIELGMRLADAGAKIVLDPRVQGKHLKAWSLWSMIRTDFAVRGVPWVGLLLKHRTTPTLLNLGWKHRLSAAASTAAVLAMVLRKPLVAGGAIAALLPLNRRFYALLLRRGGPGRALAGVGLHTVHHVTAAAAVPVGILIHLLERRSQVKGRQR